MLDKKNNKRSVRANKATNFTTTLNRVKSKEVQFHFAGDTQGRSQNSRNRHKHKNNSSSYVGVCWHKGRNRWVSRIKRDGKSIHLGYFAEEEKAHKAYEHARAEWEKEDGVR